MLKPDAFAKLAAEVGPMLPYLRRLADAMNRSLGPDDPITWHAERAWERVMDLHSVLQGRSVKAGSGGRPSEG